MRFEINYDYCITGWPDAKFASIYRTIKKKCIRRRDFWVGMTNDPEYRANNYPENDGWCKMYILYRTDSDSHKRQMETFLIDKFRSKYKKAIKNQKRGGGGRPGEPPHYVYVVVSGRRFRLR